MWVHFAEMPLKSWNSFINSDNICSQKLLAHFCAMLLLLRSIYPRVQNGNITKEPFPALTTWIRLLTDNIIRLSKLEASTSSDTCSVDLGTSDSGCEFDIDTNPTRSSSTFDSSFAQNFVPLQIANEYDWLASLDNLKAVERC